LFAILELIFVILERGNCRERKEGELEEILDIEGPQKRQVTLKGV